MSTHPIAATERRTDPADRRSSDGDADGLLRRSVLQATAITLGGLGFAGSALADPADSDGNAHTEVLDVPVDEPDGFLVDPLAMHARFPDDVAARFLVRYPGSNAGTVVSNLPRDASNVIFAKVTWRPDGTTGWHTHPGPVIVSITQGEIEVVNERDCIPRRYAAGQAFIDPGQGNVHIASNASDTEEAAAYATFLGVPDGAPPTIWTQPVDC
jgi:quercetin dioxygenase-like cupin family protein